MTSNSPTFDWRGAHERLEQLAKSLESAGRLSPQQAKEVMDQRARDLANSSAAEVEATPDLELVTFGMVGEPYAIETRVVREVTTVEAITPLPGAPSHLLGVMNLRGEILPVVNLSELFELVAEALPAAPQVMIIGEARAEFAAMIDTVSGVVALRRADVFPPPATLSEAVQDLLVGVTSKGLLVLNGHQLLHDSRLTIDETERSIGA